MLKRKTKEDLALLKDREYFEKPSEIRNQAKQAAKLREKRRQKQAILKKSEISWRLSVRV